MMDGGDHGWRQGRVVVKRDAWWRVASELRIGWVVLLVSCSSFWLVGWSNPNPAPRLAALGEGRSVGAHERRCPS